MRKDSVNVEKRNGEKDLEKPHKSKKFSWNWFRYRRKDNKIDRRAQLEKDMKDNWRELPTTLRRKQKMSQEILDEFMKDPSEPETLSSSSSAGSSSGGSTSSKPEVIYSQVKKEGKNRDKIEVHKGDEVQIDVRSVKVDDNKPDSPAKKDETPLGIQGDGDADVDSSAEVYSVHDYEDIKIIKSDEKTRVEIVSEVKGVEGRTKLELPPTENDEWLEKEQQHVMQLLNHAVSEDSLLASTSSGSSSSSEEELQDDSGTDINNPSSSSSSCNNDPIPVPSPQSIPMIIIDPPINPLKTDKSLNYSNYEIPIQVKKNNENENTILDAEYGISNGTSSKADSLLTSSEGSQELVSEDSTIPANVLFKNSDNEVDEFGFYDIPVSIPRAGLQPSNRMKEGIIGNKEVTFKTDEESAMEFYDSVVRDEQKERHSFQVEIEVHRDEEDRGMNGYPLLKKGDRLVEDFDDDLDEKHLSMDFFVEENFSKIVDRMQFSTGAKWKKALLMQTLGRKPKGMATIIEETTVEEETTPEQLTVREILRRFEELGCEMLPAEEKSATLKEIYDTLKCLEEKVRVYETKLKTKQQLQNATAAAAGTMIQQKSAPRITAAAGYPAPPHSAAVNGNGAAVNGGKASADGWNSRHQHVPTHAAPAHPHGGVAQQKEHGGIAQQQHEMQGQHDGKHSLLQFAMHHFRASPEKFEMLKTADGSISGSLKQIESLKSNKKSKNKKDKEKDKDKDKGSNNNNNNNNKENDWTWKEQVDLVKFTSSPIEMSLLRLESAELSELAVECFASVMRYMGDLPMTTDLSEVKCVYTILMHCHKHESLRDEVYCQLMKQTTNNKSPKPDSCQRGWRLFSIVAAYFTCSDTLRPYLTKYLETAAYDKRRAYHGTATVCLQNLRKTLRHGGRKNVPSVEELTAISAGRNSKRQIYQLPGGSERVVNTKSTTVVQDVIEEMCAVINVQTAAEMEEFSLYCIVEGDTFTMPLARDEYILDVTTELHKNQQVFYLIFCRSVWHFPLRLDSQLYIEVVFNQIAPDYLEGLLLVMPGEQLEQDVIYDIAKMAALLHRAADMSHLPTMKETKFLLPKPALAARDVKPAQWVNMVQSGWREVEPLQTIQAKAQVLEILSKWPLFGSSFFAVKRMSEPKERAEHILALNRQGVHFIDLVTHETLMHYTFSEVISTRKVKSEDGTLFLDMKCGNLMQQRITRLQTDQAHEISRLIRQYITMEQKLRS